MSVCRSILKYQYSNERKKTANEIPQFVRLIFHVCYFQLLVCLFDHCKHFWMSCNKIDCLSIYNVFNVYILPAIVPALLRFIFKYTGLSQRRRGTVRLYFAFFPKMLWFLPFCASFSLSFPWKWLNSHLRTIFSAILSKYASVHMESWNHHNAKHSNPELHSHWD